MTEQDPPFAVQLEPTEGCSLACSFCGIQSIRANGANAEAGVHGANSAPYKFMRVDTVAVIASQAAKLGWNPRWEFAMHGEPTMNKDLPDMVAAVRRHHPKGYIMVTSNGSGLLGVDSVTKVARLFKAGLNTLALDLYNHAPFRDRLVELSHTLAHLYEVRAYPEEKQGNPHKRHTGKLVTLISDISTNTSGTHKLTNQGGASFAPERLDQRCAKPFRELSVRWDGNVALCCDDWNGRYKIGNVLTMPLHELWNHPRFEAARRHLYFAHRDFSPCAGCNVRTSRNGLLPDKYGNKTMELPDAESDKHIREALAGRVFTIKEKK